MLICFLCPLNFSSVSCYIKHIKIKHYDDYKAKKFKCHQGTCNREFQNPRSFRKHLTEKHLNLNSTDASGVKRIDQCRDASQCSLDVDYISESGEDNIIFDSLPAKMHDIKANIKKAAVMFLAKLHASDYVNRKTVQEVVNGLEDMLDIVLPELKNEVISVLSSLDINPNSIVQVADAFNYSSKMFSDLNSEHKRLKYFTENEFYTAPVEYTIENTLNYITKDGRVVLEEDKCTGQYILIADTLKKILSIPGAYENVISHYKKIKVSKYNSG
jgi:hypothetical protein